MLPEDISKLSEPEKLRILAELFTTIHSAPYGKIKKEWLDDYQAVKSSYLDGHDHLERSYPDPDLRNAKFDAFVMGYASRKLKAEKGDSCSGQKTLTLGWGTGGDSQTS